MKTEKEPCLGTISIRGASLGESPHCMSSPLALLDSGINTQKSSQLEVVQDSDHAGGEPQVSSFLSR